MTTWHEYIKASIGFKIFIGICLLSTASIVICIAIEKKWQSIGMTNEDKKLQTIILAKRLYAGMLIGFVTTVLIGVSQFIFRFHFFSVLQEIGVLSLGFIGAVFGALCGMIKWRKLFGFRHQT